MTPGPHNTYTHEWRDASGQLWILTLQPDRIARELAARARDRHRRKRFRDRRATFLLKASALGNALSLASAGRPPPLVSAAPLRSPLPPERDDDS